MIKTVKTSKALKGEITIPADKSVSHRAVMLSSLARGKSIIKNFSSGADCRSTLLFVAVILLHPLYLPPPVVIRGQLCVWSPEPLQDRILIPF